MQSTPSNGKNHGYETLRFAGLFPIAFGYWVIRLTLQTPLRSFSASLITTCQFRRAYSDPMVPFRVFRLFASVTWDSLYLIVDKQSDSAINRRESNTGGDYV